MIIKNMLVVSTVAFAAAILSGCGYGIFSGGVSPEPRNYYMPPEPPDLSEARSMSEQPDNIEGLTLGLDECIEIALRENRRVAFFWNRAMAVEARIGDLRSLYYPALNLTAGGRREDRVNLDGRGIEGPANVWDAGLRADYLLYDGGERAGLLEGAKAETLEARMLFNASLLDTILTVRERYFEFLNSQWLHRISQQRLEQAEYHLELAEARRRAGLATGTDVLRSQTGKAEAELELIRAESAVEVARGRLASAMGLPVNLSFDVADVETGEIDKNAGEIEQLLARAAADRPELQAAAENVRARRAALKAVKSTMLPAVSADASYGARDRDFPPTEDEWSLGIRLDWPIFTGFSRSYRIQRAEYLLASATDELEILIREVEEDVWRAWWSLNESYKAMDVADRVARISEESLRAIEEEYKHGIAGMADLIDARTAWIDALNRQARARLDWHLALARLERALGAPPDRMNY